MRNSTGFLLLASIVLVLAGCSGSGRDALNLSDDSEGPALTPQSCDVDPRQYADARKIADIDDGGSCRVRQAWNVSAIGGVTLNNDAIMNCSTTRTTSVWLDRIVQPAAAKAFGEKVAAIDVAASYACRTRNNARGAKLSEHARGNAIDVAAFVLESGRRVTVEDGWNGKRDENAFLRRVRSDACGLFSTVLGPGSDRYHHNHLHLDLQQRRSGGSYCH